MTVETPPSPTGLELAPTSPAERCTGCGDPLAIDQRYCLNCGKRRAGARVDFEKYLDSEPPNTPPPAVARPVAQPPEDNRPEREVTPLMAAVGLTAVAVILILGVLIGRSGGSGDSPAATPVIAAAGTPTTAAPTSTSSSTTTNVTFEPDWPSGTEGFTIELATLPKDTSDGTAVETAKTDLLAQGATEVGALDSDEYPSLPEGNYVLYSGVFDTKAEAEAALEPLKASFPDAQVVEVSATAETASTGGDGGGLTGGGGGATTDDPVEATTEDLEALAGATGEDYEEAQKKLPPTISTPGEAPPKDNKAPGGGAGGAIEIG